MGATYGIRLSRLHLVHLPRGAPHRVEHMTRILIASSLHGPDGKTIPISLETQQRVSGDLEIVMKAIARKAWARGFETGILTGAAFVGLVLLILH
jgi:hypothetical protein